MVWWNKTTLLFWDCKTVPPYSMIVIRWHKLPWTIYHSHRTTLFCIRYYEENLLFYFTAISCSFTFTLTNTLYSTIISYLYHNIWLNVQELQKGPTYFLWLLSTSVSSRLFTTTPHKSAFRSMDVSKPCSTLSGMFKNHLFIFFPLFVV